MRFTFWLICLSFCRICFANNVELKVSCSRYLPYQHGLDVLCDSDLSNVYSLEFADFLEQYLNNNILTNNVGLDNLGGGLCFGVGYRLTPHVKLVSEYKFFDYRSLSNIVPNVSRNGVNELDVVTREWNNNFKRLDICTLGTLFGMLDTTHLYTKFGMVTVGTEQFFNLEHGTIKQDVVFTNLWSCFQLFRGIGSYISVGFHLKSPYLGMFAGYGYGMQWSLYKTVVAKLEDNEGEWVDTEYLQIIPLEERFYDYNGFYDCNVGLSLDYPVGELRFNLSTALECQVFLDHCKMLELNGVNRLKSAEYIVSGLILSAAVGF